ncbi:MAG: hypothetical protein WDN69_11760 [Aliidongia sp.]
MVSSSCRSAPHVAHDLIGSNNAFISGAALSLFPILSGVIGILAKPLPARLTIGLGSAASALGMALLATSVARQELYIFLAATMTAGTGYSLLFLGGLAVINAAAPVRHRGGVLSAIFLLAYLFLAWWRSVSASSRPLQASTSRSISGRPSSPFSALLRSCSSSPCARRTASAANAMVEAASPARNH